jgi:putative transcriptional regulator
VRENTRYKVADLARRTGMSRQALYAWLDGTLRSIPLDTLAQLCVFLECQPGDLLVLVPSGREEAEPA